MRSKSRLAKLAILGTTLASCVLVLVVNAQTAPTWTSDFSGTPAAPLSKHPDGWDVLAFAGRDGAFPNTMFADHGTDCSPPPLSPAPRPAFPNPPDTALPWPTITPNQHAINNIADGVYQCNDHFMTAVFNGYGAVYMTPPVEMDFTNGASTLDWNMSTNRTASRDWIDIVVMPFNENMELNFQDDHTPNNAVHVQLAGGGNVLIGDILRGAQASPTWAGSCSAVPQPTTCHLGGSGLHATNGRNNWEDVLADRALTVSARRRDHFRIVLSQTHISVGMPDYTARDGQAFTWIDSDINPPLTWTRGVVQLNQRSYNVEKSCENPTYPQSQQLDVIGDVDNPYGATFCPPNTWHWGPVSISPSAPFTIIPGIPGDVLASSTHTVTFASPAPANAFFHASGNPSPTSISFDGGTTYQVIPTVGGNEDAHGNLGNSFWMPVPVGTTSVVLRNDTGANYWKIADISLWVDAPPTTAMTPTPTPVVTNTPTPTPTPGATNTPTPTPTATSTPTVTPTPTPTPAGQTTVTFNDVSPVNRTFNGQYPTGVIDWGTNSWYVSGPYAGFTTVSVGFNGAGLTSESFTLLTARKVVSIDAANGRRSASTVTLSCAGNPDVTVSLGINATQAITTNWTNACSSVTLSSSNGWDVNFDNIVLQ